MAAEEQPERRDRRRWRPLLAVAALVLAALLIAWRGSAVGLWVSGVSSPFESRPSRILFLGWDAQERVQLFVTRAQGGTTRVLTDAPLGVVDYAPAPDGGSVAFSSERDDGGSDVWQVAIGQDGEESAEPELLLDCGGDSCTGLTFAPDGRLLYERRAAGEAPEAGRLWWLVPDNAQTAPLFSDEQLKAQAARFSIDGAWLAYIVPSRNALQLYDFDSGDLLELPDEVGEPVAWHPSQPRLVHSNIEHQGESFSVHLWRVDLPSGEALDLSGESVTNDASPDWSLDGRWIVFGRRLPRTPQGRQLWLVRADGSDSRALTDDLQSNFGLPDWSPDGQQILVQRFDVAEPASRPGIWLVDVEDGALHEVAGTGFQPAWLP
jgi:dipeptidyl aminopeptidase/acylaminoacyl peptidase